MFVIVGAVTGAWLQSILPLFKPEHRSMTFTAALVVASGAVSCWLIALRLLAWVLASAVIVMFAATVFRIPTKLSEPKTPTSPVK